MITAIAAGTVRDLGARLVRWRVDWRWYAVVLLGPASLVLGVIRAVRHLPLFWTDGRSLHGGSPVALLVELPAMAVLFTLGGWPNSSSSHSERG